MWVPSPAVLPLTYPPHCSWSDWGPTPFSHATLPQELSKHSETNCFPKKIKHPLNNGCYCYFCSTQNRRPRVFFTRLTERVRPTLPISWPFSSTGQTTPLVIKPLSAPLRVTFQLRLTRHYSCSLGTYKCQGLCTAEEGKTTDMD